MLRRVRVDGATVSSAATDHGLSRVAFYQALEAFQREGLAGLSPRKRGPRQGHKLTDEVLDFIRAQVACDPSLGAAALAKLVRTRFRRSVHPRSIERALDKKTRP
jgi:transposase-like protein